MNRFIRSIRQPIRRPGAENYVLITLISFAVSVTLTRLFLRLTGYPQVGGGGYHIAHLLWGGLFLYIATLVTLVFANRWFLTLSAILGGAGIGLFIDEVGKFITSNNNYFHPLAAPIIYAFFLLSVLVFLRISKPVRQDPHTEIIRALDGLEEVIEHDLEPHERDALEAGLEKVAQSDQRDLARLATELLDFLRSDAVDLAPNYSTFLERLADKGRNLEDKYITKNLAKIILVVGLIGLGLFAFVDVLRAIPFQTTNEFLLGLRSTIGSGDKTVLNSSTWIQVRLILEGVIGALLIISAALFIINEKRGIFIARFSLLASLTTVNLFIFYYDQFSTIVLAIIQLCFLLAIIRYRKRFI